MTNAAVFVWGIFIAGWKKLPWWVQIPMALLIGPNFIVNTVVFYAFVVPFFTQQFHVMARPYKEARDNQIKEIVLTNRFQYQAINQRLDALQQHQSLMMAELLRRRED